MGYPISAVVANLYTKFFEEERPFILHEGFHEVVLLFLQVLSLLCDAPWQCVVVKTLYCIPLHTCWMVRPKVHPTPFTPH